MRDPIELSNYCAEVIAAIVAGTFVGCWQPVADAAFDQFLRLTIRHQMGLAA